MFTREELPNFGRFQHIAEVNWQGGRGEGGGGRGGEKVGEGVGEGPGRLAPLVPEHAPPGPGTRGPAGGPEPGQGSGNNKAGFQVWCGFLSNRPG